MPSVPASTSPRSWPCRGCAQGTVIAMLERSSNARRTVHVFLTFPNGKQREHPECSPLSGGRQKTHPRRRDGSCSAEGTSCNARLPSTARVLPLRRGCWHPSPTLPGERNGITPGVRAQLPPARHRWGTWPRGNDVQPVPGVLSRTSVSPRGHHPCRKGTSCRVLRLIC